MTFARLRQLVRHTFRNSRRHIVGSSSLLGDRFNLGISARLVIAFVGVGALVLAANFMVEQAVLVERTTQITRTVPAPVAAPRRMVPPPTPAPEPEPRPVTVQRSVTSDRLLMTLDRFGEASAERSRAKNEGTAAAFAKASAEVKQAADAFTSTATSIAGKSFGKLAAAVKAHVQHGEKLAELSDERREAVRNYAGVSEALNARVKASIAGSYKIFGRVLARQSLLQLSADLDSLRRHTPAFTDEAGQVGMDDWTKAEETVGKDVDTNRAGLLKSEGNAWYTTVSADLSALSAARHAIADAGEQCDQADAALAREAAALVKSIPAKVEGTASVVAPPKKKAADTNVHPLTAPLPALEAPSASIASEAPAPVIETRSISNASPHSYSRRLAIAWISIGAVLLLIYIAAGTVWSIVRPVRRLLRASARLAKGDTDARVQRGGIKELDSVAVAFNAMAEELAQARSVTRDYQESLERTVAERTRQLQALAQSDPLTGLPNRRQLFTLLGEAIARARSEQLQLGVFFLDIDNFKNINDGMGHAFGDQVLVAMAERLNATVESFGFAARLGGDEFTVVFAAGSTGDAIRAAGAAIVQAFQRPLLVDGRELIVSVSVGASMFPDHGQDPDALLKAADVALFNAKELGRSQLAMFTPALLDAAAAKFATEQGLRRAIVRGEFELAFQPEVCAETLQTSLVEALVRWRMPDGSLAPPGHFLAVAEESGLIMDISEWVMTSAVQAAAHWHHGAWPAARVAINVVPRQLADPRFVERLVELMHSYRLPSRCIEIELTESVLQTGHTTIDALRRLRAHGIAIALDDFGTGYSSLASLEQLPLTRIKLDRSLIAGIDSSPRSKAIARAIISMCQSLGLEITAEGIERPEQFAMLVGERGMYLQGYLLARPTPRDELIPLMSHVAALAQSLLLESKPPSGGRETVAWRDGAQERGSEAAAG